MAAGRPRDFDLDTALDAAMHVFWKKGYEGASLTDLTSAMGINRPSLYAAFGNKEDLFLKVLDHYACQNKSGNDALSAPNLRMMATTYLYGIADAQADSTRPRGCLMINGALACSETGEPVRRELVARRKAKETMLCERIKQGRTDGELPDTANPADLARYLATIAHGMAVQALGGATCEELRRVADIALAAWPTR